MSQDSYKKLLSILTKQATTKHTAIFWKQNWCTRRFHFWLDHLGGRCLEKQTMTILVLGEPGGLLSKELLYTAITRQKESYAKHDILEGENLIVSRDSLNGGIDSAEIKRRIDTYLT